MAGVAVAEAEVEAGGRDLFGGSGAGGRGRPSAVTASRRALFSEHNAKAMQRYRQRQRSAALRSACSAIAKLY